MTEGNSNLTAVPFPVSGCAKGNRYLHGATGTKLFGVWRKMKCRCGNPKYREYHYYGGRGISVCQEWSDSFTAFRDWAMSHGYEEGLQIDRIDNDGNYCPENCRFVTHSQNQMNTRKREGGSSKYRGVCWRSKNKKWQARITIDGHTKSLGLFPTQIAAAIAFDDAARELHGEFAMLNFPERKRT